jgi:copper(I)-binding protein
MNMLFTRRGVLQMSVAAGTASWLPPVRACQFSTPTLTVTHPWTRASEPGASTAAVCMLFDEVLATDRLVSVRTPVAADAEMAGLGASGEINFLIPQGQTTRLDESGTWVRLVGLRVPLEIGTSHALELGFERGGVINATLTVDYARFR